MSKIKVAVVGCGSIAKHRHIKEYASHSKVEFVAFCDLNKELADEYAQKFNAKSYTSYEELLAHEKVDAVSVCTQNSDHAKVSIAAAKAGAHVLCEKPMATSLEEAEAMIKAAKDSNVFLMIGHNQRLMPPHVKVKEILQSGKLGKLLPLRRHLVTADRRGGVSKARTAGSFKRIRHLSVLWAILASTKPISFAGCLTMRLLKLGLSSKRCTRMAMSTIMRRVYYE